MFDLHVYDAAQQLKIERNGSLPGVNSRTSAGCWKTFPRAASGEACTSWTKKHRECIGEGLLDTCAALMC